MIPSTRQTARFYDALSSGRVSRGIWGLEQRFDARKIVRSASVDRHFRQVVREFVGPRTRVLDVGCGPGGFTAVLAETAAQVVGLDVSEAWVSLAARNFEELGVRARAVLGSGGRLPFEAASFDVVTLVDVLHHLDEPSGTLREAHRVLAPGGRLLVFEPNKLNPVLTALCVFDRNEWGFLRPGMGTMRGYRRMLAPLFRVDRIAPSGLLVGPDGPRARAVADLLVSEPAVHVAGWLSPKIFVAATK